MSPGSSAPAAPRPSPERSERSARALRRLRDGDLWVLPVAVLTTLVAYRDVLAGRALSAVDVLGRYSPWSTASVPDVQNRLQTDVAQLAPLSIHFYERLRAGHLALFDPTTAGGTPLGTFPVNNNVGLLSPFQWPRLLLPDPAADTLRVLLPVLVGQVCLVLLLRRRGLDRLPALVGGVGFAFAGALWVYDYRVVAVHLLPVMLLGADRVLGGRARSGGLLVALGVWVGLLEGYPTTALTSCALTGAYAVVGARWSRAGSRPVVRVALAGALGAAASAFHLLPFLEVVRAGTFLSFRDFDATWHLPTPALLSTFASRVSGTTSFELYGLLEVDPVEGGLHVGSVLLGLAVAGLLLGAAGRLPADLRPLWTTVVPAGALLLVLMTTGTPLLEAWYALPLLGDSVVQVNRHLLVLAVAVAASGAVQLVRDRARDGRLPAVTGRAVRVVAVLSLLAPTLVVPAAVTGLVAAARERPELAEGLRTAVVLHGLVVLLTAAAVLAATAATRRTAGSRLVGSRAAVGVVVAVVLAQAVVPWHGFVAANPPGDYYPDTAGHRAVRELLGGQGRLVGVDLAYMPNTGVLADVPDLRGHAFAYAPYREMLAEVLPAEQLGRVFVQVDDQVTARRTRVLDELAVSVVAVEATGRPLLREEALTAAPRENALVPAAVASGARTPVPAAADVLRVVVAATGEGCERGLVRLVGTDGSSEPRRLRTADEPYALFLDTLTLRGQDVGLVVEGAPASCDVLVQVAADGDGEPDAGVLSASAHAADPATPLASAVQSWLHVRPAARPLVDVSTAWTCVADQRTAMDRLRTTSRGTTGTLLVGACPTSPAGGSRAELLGSAVVDDVVTARVRGDGPQLLEVRLNAWPGWRATVDGEPAELLSLNGAQLAVEVPAGTHDVRLEYRPTSLLVGAGISALAVGGGLVLLGLGARRRTADERPATGPGAARPVG